MGSDCWEGSFGDYSKSKLFWNENATQHDSKFMRRTSYTPIKDHLNEKKKLNKIRNLEAYALGQYYEPIFVSSHSYLLKN